MKNTLKILLFLSPVIFFQSCISNKRIVYFQEMNENAKYHDTFKYDRNQYKLQVNDIVNVDIVSRSKESGDMFGANKSSINPASLGGASGAAGDFFYLSGYTINDSGEVQLPTVGKIKVTGLTLPEAQKVIETRLKEYLIDASVVVRIGGIKFSLLGEFRQPGKYVIAQSQLTIFEAIAVGHDLTELARREKIVLLRQYPDGARLHYINVLDKNLMNSPYYFLQPNDMLYAEPLKRRAYGVGINGLQTFTTALTVISTTLLLINYFNR